jgi:import receptor subunit TOM70
MASGTAERPAGTIPLDNVPTFPAAPAASSSSSVWDRITKWASENKALVYTIAGVAVVVTSAGAVYYFSGPTQPSSQQTDKEKKKSKKDRRREKKKAEEEKKAEKTPSGMCGLLLESQHGD